MDELTLRYLSNPRMKYAVKKEVQKLDFYNERVLDLTRHLMDHPMQGMLQQAFERYMDECTRFFHNEDMLETLQSKYENMVEAPSTPMKEVRQEPMVPKKMYHFKVKPRVAKPFPMYQKFDENDEKFKHKRIKDNITRTYGDAKVETGYVQSITPEKKILLLPEESIEDKKCVESSCTT